MHSYFKRENIFKELLDREKIWDLIIIGGWETSLGTAVDIASRGYETLLLELCDFSKGTSIKKTKLSHRGIWSLAHGDFGLVSEALREPGPLMKNGRLLVRNISFTIPNYKWWKKLFYNGTVTILAIKGRVVINASEILVDEILRMDAPKMKSIAKPSQWAHLALDQSFMSSSNALMIPNTESRRMVFTMPWYNSSLVGIAGAADRQPQPGTRGVRLRNRLHTRTV